MRVLPVAIVAVVALAGCVAPAPAVETSGSRATSFVWGVEGCAFVIATVAVDADALAALLPEGFSPIRSRLAALPAGPRALLDLDVYRCAQVAWDKTSLADASYGSYYAPVDPPAALREDGYESYFVKWDAIVADAATRETLAALGLPARAGEANVHILGPSVRASLGFEGGGGFSIVGAVSEPEAQAEPLPFMEFTPLGDGAGLARWHARLHDAKIGVGSGFVEIAPDSWVRGLVQADRVPATLIAGTWNLDEADVTAPVLW